MRSLFLRVRSKPEFPIALQRLIDMIDQGEPSARDLERLIAGQPSLAADLLRVANVSRATYEPVTTIRGAVMRLGYRSVRSLALSLVVQSSFEILDNPNLDGARYVRHSLSVAYLSKYLHAKAQRAHPTETDWSADELFAAGLLHDLALAMLDSVAPQVFARLCFYAPKRQITLEAAFAELYSQDLREIVADAMEAWGMPKLFGDSMRHFDDPWSHPALWCLHFADRLCMSSGNTIETWKVEVEPLGDEIGIPEAEQGLVMEFVESQVDQHLGDAFEAAA